MAKKRKNQVSVLIAYVLAMLVSLAIFGSAALVLRDIFVTRPELEREKASENAENSEAPSDEDEDDYSSARGTILFVGENGGVINGMAMIRMLPDLTAIRIVPVSPYTYTSVGSVEGTIQSLYEAGGMSYLKTAAETALGVECDCYIKITDDGWKSLVDYLGGTSSYSFPQDMYYKNEETGEITSFSQGAATRTLYGDDIRRIITYPLYDGGNERRLQVLGELSVSLINSACAYNSGAVIGNIQTIFNVIYNNSDSNITSKRFSEVREAYEYLIGNSTSPASYRLPTGSWDSRGYFNVDASFAEEIKTYFVMEEEGE